MAGSEDTATLLSKVAEAVAGGRLTATAGQNIQRWLTTSGYRPYVPRVAALVGAGKWDELDSLFWEVIPFGTGGRRGPMSEFGSATMNDRTVAESADGLASYFLATARGTGNAGRAVVAHDTRNRSADFAKITARVLAGHGLTVYLFESHRSTPELSFAVRHLKCDVGAMISASHNPPADNGFKAYWSNGAQVLPPHDKGIIEAVYRSNEIPMVDFDQAVADGRIVLVGEAVDAAYIQEVVAQSLSPARDLAILFTPLHGVGETSLFRSLREAGFSQATIFEGQRAPDGNFPGVPKQLPNPELPAVFDPPLVEARAKHIPLILASDPDADRLGVCVRGGNGAYTHLTGNRIGVLLADYILRKRAAAGRLKPTDFLCETLVTTPLVGAIGRKHGIRVFDELLVGFKYIAQLMDREGAEHFVFGAEESLGYLTGGYARDKDASVAGLLLSEAAAELKLEGKTLLDRLDDLFVEHGYFLETQKSETRTGPRGKAQIDQLMSALATSPPVELAGLPFQRVRDYVRHEVRAFPGNRRVADLPEPKGDMLVFEAKADDCEITLAARPSGTEPKIKFYFFARAVVADRASLDAVRSAAERRLADFTTALMSWAGSVWET
jgi:phosphoglucomutase/phosphomannomutase